MGLGKLLAWGRARSRQSRLRPSRGLALTKFRRQPTSKSPSTQAPGLTDNVLVCVDSDDLLRSPQGEGRLRASMSVADGVGAFHIFSVGGSSVLSMRQSRSGAGLLSIGNSDGAEVVKMDVNDNRYGAVLAGPRLGFPLVTGSGLPGSYILGCARRQWVPSVSVTPVRRNQP